MARDSDDARVEADAKFTLGIGERREEVAPVAAFELPCFEAREPRRVPLRAAATAAIAPLPSLVLLPLLLLALPFPFLLLLLPARAVAMCLADGNPSMASSKTSSGTYPPSLKSPFPPPSDDPSPEPSSASSG
jgi:hypothetical protein